MIDINLLPSAQRRSVLTFDRTFAMGLLILAVLVVGIIVFDVYERYQIASLNSQIDNERQTVTKLQDDVKQVTDLRDQAQQLRAKADLLERVKQSPTQVAEILSDIANNTPHGV